MVRKKLIWYPGATYHITSRGNHRNDIFRDGEDYLVYLTILKEALERYNGNLYCYCLMTNHVHLVIETSDIKVSEIMRRINLFYTKYFNNKYNLIGHLFQGRYFAELIEEDKYVLSKLGSIAPSQRYAVPPEKSRKDSILKGVAKWNSHGDWKESRNVKR